MITVTVAATTDLDPEKVADLLIEGGILVDSVVVKYLRGGVVANVRTWTVAE